MEHIASKTGSDSQSETRGTSIKSAAGCSGLAVRPSRVHRQRGANCRSRLRAWIKAVVARSPIWGDLDIAVFCRETGYSREHATRTLSAIRREGEFAFETKIRSSCRRCARNWGVIVADPRKLRFDRASLFYDARGRALHNRSTLARGGEKLASSSHPLVPHGRTSGEVRLQS